MEKNLAKSFFNRHRLGFGVGFLYGTLGIWFLSLIGISAYPTTELYLLENTLLYIISGLFYGLLGILIEYFLQKISSQKKGKN